ncbi:pilus assembly protein [Streptomyces sp. NPDC002889]|uniref:pilus assembly protein n=1 Tax=Streptomyces sp. NPDC002889 TaxID=3364669 RepID=UPI00368E6312
MNTARRAARARDLDTASRAVEAREVDKPPGTAGARVPAAVRVPALAHQVRPAVPARPQAVRPRDDRGQSVIEFTGMVPIILVTLAVLWQSALVGYTFVLAGNAADKAVRAGTVAEGDRVAACEAAGRQDVPGSWTSVITCRPDGDLLTAEARLDVPLLFPGGFNLPIRVPGQAAAALERD